jgi:glucose/mannose-6-phosphate isomerase
MGGSALPGYLIASLLPLKMPVIIHSGYGLPKQLTKNPLFFISSFSGNTEESLDCLLNARRKNFTTIIFSSGGRLKEIADKEKISQVYYGITDPNFQPRYALPLVFSAMTKVLENCRKNQNLSAEVLELAEFLKSETCQETQELGRKIANKINGRIPIFYADFELRFAAMINKIKINENSKLPAFWNYYPELNHNEFNGFLNGRPKDFIFISLGNKDGHHRNQKRMKITENILTKMKYNVIRIEAKGKSTLCRFFFSLCLGDWISYYLALSIGQDPSPVEMVEELKKKLT